MRRFCISFPMREFTEAETNSDSSTVSDDAICRYSEYVARRYAQLYRWRDGAGDLLAWAWQSLTRLRDKGTPVRAWARAISFDFIDLTRSITDYRRTTARVQTVNFSVVESDRYNATHSHGDNGVCTANTVEARRYAPDTVDKVLADFEHELVSLNARERAIVCALVRGHVMWQIAESLNLSESRVSQIVAQICERFHGHYPRNVIVSDPDTPARITHRDKMLERAREAYAEKLSENFDVPG